MYNEEDILDNEPGFRLNAWFEKYFKTDLPVLENSNGEVLIKPAFRKNMKKEFQQAFKDDLNDIFRLDLAEVVLTTDGLVIVVQNENEGNFTIQLDTKFKNLSYDAYDNLVDEEDEE